MSGLPVLYSFRRCPYAIRARMALAISGTRCELREVKLSAKPDALIEASEKATVPVVVLPEGQVIDESIDVMRWALGLNDPEGWLEREDPALITANDGPFKHHLDRYKYPHRYEDCDPLEHQAAALDLLMVLEGQLEGQANLSGQQRGMSDAAIMPFVRQFAATDRDWFAAQSLPNLQAWLERHLASQLFKSIMTKWPLWSEGDMPTVWPEQ